MAQIAVEGEKGKEKSKVAKEEERAQGERSTMCVHEKRNGNGGKKGEGNKVNDADLYSEMK